MKCLDKRSQEEHTSISPGKTKDKQDQESDQVPELQNPRHGNPQAN